MKCLFLFQNWSSQLEVKIFPRCPLRTQLKRPIHSSAMPCLSETRESSYPCCSPLRYRVCVCVDSTIINVYRGYPPCNLSPDKIKQKALKKSFPSINLLWWVTFCQMLLWWVTFCQMFILDLCWVTHSPKCSDQLWLSRKQCYFIWIVIQHHWFDIIFNAFLV